MSDRTLQIIVAVAPLLTGAWRFNHLATEKDNWPNRFSITDDREPGRTILATECSDNNGPRFKLSGLLPRSRYLNFSSNHMTVSQNRSPLAIAHDINRRLIPGYVKQWNKAKQSIAQQVLEDTAHAQKIELVRRATNNFRGQYGNKIDFNSSNFTFDGGSLLMHSGSSSDPEIKLRLPYDKMLKVLHFVKDLWEPET